ncbi:MAG: glycosyltransferase family 4 protein, partial [Bacteroidales bacterium]
IERIFLTEKSWLSMARKVFFESEWGAQKAQVHYNLIKERLVGLGRGGSIPFPDADRYNGSLQLLLVANHFLQKGGDLAYQAFIKIRQTSPDVTFHIVGGDPGIEIRNTPGVVYHGFLRKEQPAELQQLVQLYADAFLLLHPTREDTNPLVITEAGYFGCPAISVDRFAIPELIRNGDTGFLLKVLSVEGLVSTIRRLIDDKEAYIVMRNHVLTYSRSHFSWDTIGHRLRDTIKL